MFHGGEVSNGMNKNNFAILIFIVVVAAGISYAVGSAVLGKRANKPIDVETAQAISSDIVAPEPSVFTSDAINPTVQITIGDNTQNPIGN